VRVFFHLSMDFEDPALLAGGSSDTIFVACAFATAEDAISVAKRSISVQSVSSLLAAGDSLASLLSACASADHDVNAGSFAVRVQCHMRHVPDATRRGHIADLIAALRIASRVDLRQPDRDVLLSLQFAEGGEAAPLRAYASILP